MDLNFILNNNQLDYDGNRDFDEDLVSIDDFLHDSGFIQDTDNYSVFMNNKISENIDITELEDVKTLIDIEFSMRLMDQRYKTNFCGWIVSPENINVATNRIKKIMMNYPEENIKIGLKWYCNFFSNKQIGKILNILFYDIGFGSLFMETFDFISSDFDFRDIVSIVSYIMRNQTHVFCAYFISSMNNCWGKERTLVIFKHLRRILLLKRGMRFCQNIISTIYVILSDISLEELGFFETKIE